MKFITKDKNVEECVRGSFGGKAHALHPAATDGYAIISMYISYSPVEIRTGSPS